MPNEEFWTLLSICYFVGGLTIGYYFSLWKHGKKKTGTGRWDFGYKKPG